MQRSTGQYYDPTHHWAALLRYDASRRLSADVEGRRSLNADQAYRPSKVKQMSIGDDLPHMVEYSSVYHQSSSLPRGAQVPRYNSTAAKDDVDTTQEDVYADEEELTLGRQITPPALKGENAILVDRELERLRLRKPMARRMKWRVLTGTTMLLVLAFTAYIFAQYLIAYLALSPSTWFLSDSQTGTHVSPDPLLRSLAMLELIISGVALFGILASGFYLRMTRRRSCGRGLIWCMAIISTTLNVGLSVANVALIVGWHKRYASDSGQQLARTRDVGLRCQGSWDMDMLWGAADNSMIAKPDSDLSSSSVCKQDPSETLQAFLIAGGVRLAVFVLLSTVWLICLGRYNATSAIASLPANISIEESPEMHKLLAEEQGVPNEPFTSHDSRTIKSRGDPPEMLTMNQVPDGFGGFVREEEMKMPGMYRNLSNLAPPPKTVAFRRPRTEMASGEEAKSEIQTYGNLPRSGHDREGSAWSRSFMDRVYTALWGTHADEVERAVETDDEGQNEGHGREMTRLGVRGWFASRDVSRLSDEDDHNDETMTEKLDEDIDLTEQFREKDTSYSFHTQTYEVFSTQEERSRQGRHATTQKIHDSAGDEYTVGHVARTSVRQAPEERSSKRKKEQQDRLTFLANLQFDRRNEETDLPLDQSTLPLKDSGNHANRANETLLRMPTVQEVNTSSSAFHERFDDGIDEDDDFWHAAPVNRTSDRGGPTYVRQLGKLVHRLSAIESVGSGGERSQHRSRTSREPSALSTLY